MSEVKTPPKAGVDAAKKLAEKLEKLEKPEPKVFSTMSALDIYKDTHEEPPEIWGGLQYVAGYIMQVIGPAGLGKSRLMLNLAVNQILGQSFAGMDTYMDEKKEKDKENYVDGSALTWLFYGNENSFFRFRNDLKGMFKKLKKPALDKLGRHLYLPTMDNPDDCYISFADDENQEKFLATIVARNADVVVMDPWGAVIAGDELSDADVRKTINDITRRLHEATAKLGHPVMAIILNHSRNGLKEFINACGPNRGDYGKNSKAIHSVVRVVWNLRPGVIDGEWNKIEFIHAKGNDGKTLDPVCVKFDPETMTYDFDETFNHDVFQAMLESVARKGSAMSKTEKANAEHKIDEDDREKILKYIQSKGSISRQDLEEYTNSKEIGTNKARAFLAKLKKEGKITVLIDKSNHHLVCDSAKVDEIFKKAPEGYYRVKKPSGQEVLHDTPREEPPDSP